MNVIIHEVPVEETLLAKADCSEDFGCGYVELDEMRFPWDDRNFCEKTFFHVKERIMDTRETDRIFNTFWEAARYLKSVLTDRTYRWGGDVRKVYPEVKVTDRFREREREMDDYETKQVEKDYGPGNPWDAPGMKISDFIGGVAP